MIALSDGDFAKIERQNWQDHPEFRGTQLTLPFAGGGLKSRRLAHKPDGSCVFLRSDGLCRIHAEFGSDAKPITCQTFPLQIVAHEQQAVVTMRRACPSAGADRGELISRRLTKIQSLVNEDLLQANAIAAPQLKSTERRDWPRTQIVLNAVGGLLNDQHYPPVRRVVHALQFVTLIESAKTRSLSTPKLSELADTLAELAPDESAEFFSDRKPPKGYAKILFRLMAVVCARLHPLCRHQSSWGARLDLTKTAIKMVRGSGQTPVLSDTFGAVDFGKLEQPTGALSPAIYQPLARFIETNGHSFLYAIADRQRWTVLESVRNLALLYPVGLWLLRWQTQDRVPTVTDMLNIIVALDRSQGYLPLTGPFQRFRISTLAAHSELERLVVWYSR